MLFLPSCRDGGGARDDTKGEGDSESIRVQGREGEHVSKEGEGTSRVGANNNIMDDDVLIIGGGGRVRSGAEDDEGMSKIIEQVKGMELEEDITQKRRVMKEVNSGRVCM